MKSLIFATRNRKEILRDPINFAFGLIFPVALILLFRAIQANVPDPIFVLNQLTPGISAFGLSFISLFSGMLIAKDRSSSFLMRLFASPLSASDYIFGYIFSLLPMAFIQSALCFLVAFALGMEVTIGALYSVLVLTMVSFLYIGFGLLCGSIFTDRQVGGICGALLTNLSALLSGAWFDLKLVGGVFQTVGELLPFSHAVELARAAQREDFAGFFPHLWWVLAYSVLLFSISVLAFTRKMKNTHS